MNKLFGVVLLCLSFGVNAQTGIGKSGEGFWKASATNGSSPWVPLRSTITGIGLKVTTGHCTVDLAFESFGNCTNNTAIPFEWPHSSKPAGNHGNSIAGASCARVTCASGSGTIYVKN